MVNSRHDSPIKEVASSSDVIIEEMFSSIMKEMHEVRGNVNAMQGGFTAFHEDINLLRDRVGHNHSIAPSDRERHGRSGYKSRYHDDGLVRGSRRERAPMFHGESHSRWMRDHDRHKVHEWLKGEEVSSKVSKSSSSRHGGGDTSRRSIPPKKVDLSHPSYHTKVSLWLSSNFPLSKSLIQSARDNFNYIFKERVKHTVDFVAEDDEEQCEDEKESMGIHELDARPTFNDGVSSIVEAEEECEPLNALQILNTEPKLHEVHYLLYPYSRQYIYAVAEVGVCYGRLGSNLPCPEDVALGGSGVELMLGIPEADLPDIAKHQSHADDWANIGYPDVKFRYIVVGNEVEPSSEYGPLILPGPAMKNIHNALCEAGLEKQIAVSTSIKLTLLGNSSPPSHGEFLPHVTCHGENPCHVVTNISGVEIQSDTWRDCVRDWASDGEFKKIETPETTSVEEGKGDPSSVENARIYNTNLMRAVKKGTPKRPGPEYERHFGIFRAWYTRFALTKTLLKYMLIFVE
ncbi:hypothetical protein SASPL_100867 [Salvia splendens]|uniref:Glucan endo-1,3-beta-D-glucosidase n=1 Tax=Salvia splendens TaxID=180675 RepID=A0A8X9ACV9_SALSN|nr:hypothetical protein SASPL_100867 [Salvia splendens]